MPFNGQNKAYSRHILFFLQVCRYLLDAAKSGNVNPAKRWAHCNSDSCATDDNRRLTPLSLAAYNDHVEVVLVLLERGADVQRTNYYKVTALHWAAENGYLEVCRLLLDWGANVNTDGWDKNTALHWASSNGHLSIVKLLVGRGADVTLENINDQTAGVLARSKGHTAVADWLDSISLV
jgi:ankyrin repeat protein